MFYKIRRTFRNLRDWLPIIIKDEHWDEYYFFKLLHRKLELKEKFFRGNHAFTVDAEKVADEIKIVKDAMKRVIDDNYINWDGDEELTDEMLIKEDELRRYDLDLIFNQLRENIEHWWD